MYNIAVYIDKFFVLFWYLNAKFLRTRLMLKTAPGISHQLLFAELSVLHGESNGQKLRGHL